MRDGRRIFDADAHVVEPGGVFGDAVPPGTLPMDLPPTTPFVPCGDMDKVADQMEHGFDAPSYLRALDAEGIDAVVLYPSIGLFAPFQPQLDAAQSADTCRRYNDWVAGYCDHDRSRLAAAGLVPMIDPGLAAKEAERCADLGLVGVLVRPNHLYGRNLGDTSYDALYETVAGRDLVLAVHEGLGLQGATIGTDRFDGFALRHALSHPMEQMAAMASLFLEGSLERHPTMKVAFLESGTGWLPYWLHRLDEHAEWATEECAGLSCKPSEYFARQCVISTDPEDELVASVVAQVGADHVLWASDFPHPDALFPDAAATFVAESSLSGDDLTTVLWDTPARFYGVF